MPDKLDVQEAVFLGNLAEMAPDLARAGALATGFAALVRNAPDESNGPALEAWLVTKPGSSRSLARHEAWLVSARGTALDAFVRGIDRDHDAVLTALVEPWSTGPVEGQINRLKTIKRQMYGRAGYDLLRKRVLAA